MKKLNMCFVLVVFLSFAIGCGGNGGSETTSTDSSTMTGQSTDTSIDATSSSGTTIGSATDTSMEMKK